MEALLMFILKSSCITVLFILFYALLLKRETFFRANRVYLLTGLGLSILIPFIVYTKILWLQPMPVIQNDLAIVPLANDSSMDWQSLLFYGYFAGVLLFALRFVLQLISLHNLITKCSQFRDGKLTRVETDKRNSPFSFLRYVIYNPICHSPSELKTILSHEKVHAEEWHSLDMLAMQLFTIFQWCNPFVWWYRICLIDNLEFIADTETIAKNTDKTKYQYLLLQMGMSEKHYPMATPFLNNSIKKRIFMLNKNRSDRKNSFKYALILPLLVAFIFLFNVKTKAQMLPNLSSIDAESPKTELMESNVYSVSKDSTSGALKTPQKKNKENIIAVGDNNRLYIVDGKETSESDYDNIDPDWIKTVYVWNGQQAINRFGAKGKNGVREIILKKDHLSIPKNRYASDPKVRPMAIIIQDPIYENPKDSGLFAKHHDIGELVILDGKEVPHHIINSVKPESIKSIIPRKSQQAIDRYGDRGKNGALEIILRNNYRYVPKTK